MVRIGIWPLTFRNFPFITGFKEFRALAACGAKVVWAAKSLLGQQVGIVLSLPRTGSLGGDRTLGATFVSRTPSDATLQTCCARHRSRWPVVGASKSRPPKKRTNSSQLKACFANALIQRWSAGLASPKPKVSQHSRRNRSLLLKPMFSMVPACNNQTLFQSFVLIQ